MNTEFIAAELLSLIAETRERVAYVQEMGVLGIQPEFLREAETTNQTSRTPLRSNQPPSVTPTSSLGSSPSVNATLLEQA